MRQTAVRSFYGAGGACRGGSCTGKKLLETGTTEEAVQILKEAGCLKETMEK